MTIEDRTGFGNLVIWLRLFEYQRRLLLSSRRVICTMFIQRERQVSHIIARRFDDQDQLLRLVGHADEDEMTLSDAVKRIADGANFGLKNFC